MRIGVDVGGTKIEVALMDSNDDIVFSRRITIPRDDYAAAVGAIINIVENSILLDISHRHGAGHSDVNILKSILPFI